MNHFMKTLHGESFEAGQRPPLWMMRQAGRYLPEYRAIRQTQPNFLQFCYTPKAASEVTLQPVARYGFDAAILFSDILVIPDALGMKVTFVKGEGPKLALLKTQADVARLDVGRIGTHLAPVAETVKKTRERLPSDKGLIGFCGAPWTVAAYMWDGHPSKDTLNLRTLAYEQPEVFRQQMAVLVEASFQYLMLQVEAGVDALMLFESWGGLVPPALVEAALLQPIQTLVQRLKAAAPEVPVMYFPRNVNEATLLKIAQIEGLAGLGVSHTLSLTWADENLPKHLVLQGNLDPALLRTNPEVIQQAVADMLQQVSPERRYVCNLGHGIHLDTPLENVEALVKAVHDFYA